MCISGRRAVDVPIIGIGGIANLDDVMQFLVAGASAVQIGTANYYDPTISMKLIGQLPRGFKHLGRLYGYRSRWNGHIQQELKRARKR